eukprot:TRINITY_DN61353_c0_g1_i1.p1 TRINITY_DN61353_c0_g1~~TRINITY_DN61353_c0_g1_i1.p1  ORF type:complete len:723 (-),score=122.75 TRINITY_DN61353_c0_g1_i1:144-2312(-)
MSQSSRLTANGSTSDHVAYLDGFFRSLELLTNHLETHLKGLCVSKDVKLPDRFASAAADIQQAVRQLQHEVQTWQRENTILTSARRAEKAAAEESVDMISSTSVLRSETSAELIQSDVVADAILEEGVVLESDDIAPQPTIEQITIQLDSEVPKESDSKSSQSSRTSNQSGRAIMPAIRRTIRRSTGGTYRIASLDSLSAAPALPRGIINPGCVQKLTWDFIVMFAVLFDAIALPFQLAFKNTGPQDGFDIAWFYVTTTLFSLDIIASFNTAVVVDTPANNEPPISNRAAIAKRYLRGWFMIDFISTIPWSSLEGIFAGGDSGGQSQATKLLKVVKFLRIMRLMRMLRLAKLKTIWEGIETSLGSVVLVQSVMLVRILFVVIAICHWNACIFWVVGSPESFITDLMPESSQVAFKQLPHWTTVGRPGHPGEPLWRFADQTVSETYIFCFYWTLGVMRTMPAEVTPVNFYERVFVLGFMFFALSAFAISVGSLTQAFFKISERGRNYNDEMFAVRMYLKNLGVSQFAQRRIKNYLGHLFERRRIMAKEANLLEKLPDSLKVEVKRAKIFQYLQKIPVVSELSKDTIEEICGKLDLFDRLPGDVVCLADGQAEAAWVLCSGKVQIQDSKGEHTAPQNHVDVIDGDCLLSDETILSEFTVIAVTCCEMLKVDKELFQMYANRDEVRASLRRSSRRAGRPLEVKDTQGAGHEPSEEAAAASASISC